MILAIIILILLFLMPVAILGEKFGLITEDTRGFIIVISTLLIVLLVLGAIIYNHLIKECSICYKRVRGKRVKPSAPPLPYSNWVFLVKKLLREEERFYIVNDDKYYQFICSKCYKSHPCNKCYKVVLGSIYFKDGKVYCTEKDGKLYCKECYEKIIPKKTCSVCGKKIKGKYYSYPSSDYIVCEECDKLPRCDCCYKPVIGKPVMDDTRPICPSCYNKAITDEKLIPEIVEKVWSIMRLAFKMEIKHQVVVQIISASGMRNNRGTINWGYFCQDGGNFKVKILRYLTQPNIYKVLAHELAHAWQAENCPPYSTTKKRFSEGFAEWVAYNVLISLMEVPEAQRMEQGMWGDYLEGFRKFKDLEKKYGRNKIFELVKTNTDFPNLT